MLADLDEDFAIEVDYRHCRNSDVNGHQHSCKPNIVQREIAEELGRVKDKGFSKDNVWCWRKKTTSPDKHHCKNNLLLGEPSGAVDLHDFDVPTERRPCQSLYRNTTHAYRYVSLVLAGGVVKGPFRENKSSYKQRLGA